MAKTREDSKQGMPWGSPLPFSPEQNDTLLIDAELTDAEQRFHWLVSMSSDPILLHSGSTLVLVNEAAAGLLGAGSPDEVIGRSISDLLPWQARLNAPQLLHRHQRKPLFVERTLIRLDGTAIEAMVSEHICRYRGQPAVQLLIRDSRRHHEKYSDTDALTGLAGRLQFRERLKRAVAGALDHRQVIALIRLNLNHFKSINNNLGHRNGDFVLKTVAHRLVECIRDHDVAARLDGDEFGIILEGLHDTSTVSMIAQRILTTLAFPLLLDDQHLRLTARIGIAFSPLDATDEDRLLNYADLAMEQARKHSPHGFQRYSPELSPVAEQKKHDLSEIEQRYSRLTPREREVLNLLIAGKANKMVAYLLGTSSRTVENHRARIMDKMQAKSLAELVQMIMDLRK